MLVSYILLKVLIIWNKLQMLTSLYLTAKYFKHTAKNKVLIFISELGF